jgi:solute carrier family 35 protein F5
MLQWFLGNYSYQAALSHTEAGLVNVLSSSSSLFTLMLAACLPSGTSDRFTLTKFIAVVFSIAGVVLVSLSDLKVEQSIPVGAGWALAGSMCYAAYLVLLKRRVDHEDKMSIPMFFGNHQSREICKKKVVSFLNYFKGFVGLINTVVMWPSFFILHATKLEIFVWPTQQQWLYIALNGLIGTVLSEFLWLW